MGDLHSINHIFDQMTPPAPRQSLNDLVWDPVCCLLLVGMFLVLSFPMAWAEINLPSKTRVPAPPMALSIRVTTHKGDPVQITLRCAGAVSLSPKFRIRVQPQFGTLSEPRLVSKDSAVVVYSPTAEAPEGEDKFTYSVQTTNGVSMPEAVLIRFVDDPMLLIVADKVDLGKVLLGQSTSSSFEIENRGGGIAEGTLSLNGDFKLVGDPYYRLARGERKSIKVLFIPVFVGPTAGTISYSGNPDRETTLQGEGLGPIQAVPRVIPLILDQQDGMRRGELEILNRTDVPQKIQIRADGRLKCGEEIEIPPGEKVPCQIEADRESPEAFVASLELQMAGFSEKAQVQVPALGPILRLKSPGVQFGQVPPSQTATKPVIVENAGGSTGTIEATVDRPFALAGAQSSYQVEPGSKVEIRVELQPSDTGKKNGTLHLTTSSGVLQVPIEAEVVDGQGSSSSTQEASAHSSGSLLERPNNEEDRQFMRPGKPIQISSVGITQAELSWEDTGAAAYSMEYQRLFLDGKGDIHFSWEPFENAQITPSGKRQVAKLSKLTPEFPYTIRVAAVNSQGEIIERTAEATFITLPKPPIFTPLRVLLTILTILIVIAARRWRRPE